MTGTVSSSEHAFPSKILNLFRTLSSWGSGNYRPSAPLLYEVASHVKNCHSGHYYYYYSASVLCSEHFSVDCFDDIPALKASLVFAVQRKRVLKSNAVPSIFKRSADVPEKKARKSTAVEKLASKRVSSVCRVSYCLSQFTATE